MLHEISEFDLYLLTRVICIYLPIYDGIWNKKTYFEIISILNFKKKELQEQENSIENKNIYISVTAKYNITLNFPTLDWQKGGNFKIVFPSSIPYHI